MNANELKEISQKDIQFPHSLDTIFAYLLIDAISGKYSSKFGKVAIKDVDIDNLRLLGYQVTINGNEITIDWRQDHKSNENYEVRRG